MTAWTLSPAEPEPVAVLAAATLACLAYKFGLSSRVLEPRCARAADPQATSVLAQHALGGLLFGAVALGGGLALGVGLGGVGLAPRASARAAAVAAVGCAALLGALSFAVRRPAHWRSYPEIRATTWTPRLWLANAGTWTLYLIGYEAFFRGFLLLAMVRWLGVPGGVAVTTALYALQHLPKDDPGEALGCLPMGVFFAWLTVEGGSIWLAVAFHIVMAVGADTLTIRANPGVRWAGRTQSG